MKKLIHSVGNAFQGIRVTFWRERNVRIEIAVSCITLLFAWYFHVRSYELIVILLLITLILVLEFVNTVVEYILDLFTSRLHGQVKAVKDITAGMVFIAAFGSVLIGLVIFVPYIIELLAYK